MIRDTPMYRARGRCLHENVRTAFYPAQAEQAEQFKLDSILCKSGSVWTVFLFHLRILYPGTPGTGDLRYATATRWDAEKNGPAGPRAR